MKRSIFYNIFSGYLVITFLLSFIIVFLSIGTVKKYFIDTKAGQLERVANSFRTTFLDFFPNNNIQTNKLIVESLGRDLDARVTLIDNDGTVIIDSEEDASQMENHKSRPEINKALDGYTGQSIRYSKTIKEDMLYVAVPLIKSYKIVGVLRLSLFMKDIRLLINNLRYRIFQTTLVVLLIAVFLAWIFSKRLSIPIKSLSDASKKIAQGNFDTRVIFDSKNELHDLAENFNYMSATIKELILKLSKQKEELETLISSVNAGIVAFGKDDRVFLANSNFNLLVNDHKPREKLIYELIKEPEFLELLKSVRNKKENQTKEIIIGEKVYLCSMTFLSTDISVIAIFNDITAMREMEQLKKELVQNVSHELRTPLSSIRGFMETIEDEKKYNQKYVDIIKNNTVRMINIVNDLLSLTELESKKFRLEKEEISLNEMLTNILKILEPKIADKNIKMKLDIAQDVPQIFADKFKVEQMALNILDNAIKYTEKGEINLEVRKIDNNVLMVFRDTGIGIPKHDIDRIFERFYVVDKSRSRTMGGTGLGLSIVKHIVLLHNGSIDVQSEPGKGTIFNVILPI
ncbi:ATP-binding protein [bacterium]